MFKDFLRHLPGFGTVHMFNYVKDTTIGKDDPRSHANRASKVFYTFAGMVLFIVRNETAQAAVRADRFQYIRCPRTKEIDAMLKEEAG